jgi:hypothetical protein
MMGRHEWRPGGHAYAGSRLTLKSLLISTLVLSFSTIACLEFQSENPSP